MANYLMFILPCLIMTVSWWSDFTLRFLPRRVQDLQIYNALISSYNVCRNKDGLKEAFDDGERSLEDIHHFLLVVDECHTLLEHQQSLCGRFVCPNHVRRS